MILSIILVNIFLQNSDLNLKSQNSTKNIYLL
jgi:hypothetical protein